MDTSAPRPRHTARSHLLIAGVALVLAALLGSCTTRTKPTATVQPPIDEIGRLVSVDNCEQLVDQTVAALSATAEAMWWQPPGPGWFERIFGGADDDMAAVSDTAVAGEAVPSQGFLSDEQATQGAAGSADVGRESASGSSEASEPTVIGTNNQEDAVDESDIVKTDGRFIYSVVGNTLRVVAADDTPSVDATLQLDGSGASEMFLRGDSLLIIGSNSDMAMPMRRQVDGRAVQDDVVDDFGGGVTGDITPAEDYGFGYSATTKLTIVSVADPATPSVTATADVEGSLVAARQIGDTARIVVRSTIPVAEDVAYAPSKDEALAAAAAVRADDLLPRVSSNGVIRSVGECSDVVLASSPTEVDDNGGVDDGADRSMPGSYVAPLDNLTVLTVGDELTDLAPTTIRGAGETVYASSDALYIASSTWDDNGSGTLVHRFDMTGDGPASHTGSGRAPGRLLNQFSLSDRAGTLRVVTTVDSPMGTSGRLTNLDTDGALEEIGHLDGMGIGEEVKSVRFLDDLGYVVTFRQTDPLYALDLSDPRNPVQLGELKIPGFSQYLHPIGNGLLLGVGSDADPTTGVVTGAKVSLFDVSDPAKMTEIDQVVLPEVWSPISEDHKAFLWDPTRNQAVLPLNGPSGGAAVVLRVEGSTLRAIAQIQHPGSFFSGVSEAPVRSFVIDDGLWTLSTAGLGRSDADTPTSVSMAPFS